MKDKSILKGKISRIPEVAPGVRRGNSQEFEAIHNNALTLFGEYIAIGGMPVAVNEWITQ